MPKDWHLTPQLVLTVHPCSKDTISPWAHTSSSSTTPPQRGSNCSKTHSPVSVKVAWDHRRDIGYSLKMGERPTRAKLVENLDWKCKGKFNLLVLSLVVFFFLLCKLLNTLKVFKLLLVSVESSHRRSSYLYMHQKVTVQTSAMLTCWKLLIHCTWNSSKPLPVYLLFDQLRGICITHVFILAIPHLVQ